MKKKLVLTLLFALMLSGCSQQPVSPSEHHFTNSFLHYSFSYPSTLKIVAPLSSTNEEVPESGFGDERDSFILLSDAQNENVTLATIMSESSPQLLEFASDQAAVQNYIDYWTSSTSQYQYPERNQVRGPNQSEVTSKSGNKMTKYEYLVTFTDESMSTSPQTQVYDMYITEQGGKNADTKTRMPYSFLVIKYLQADQEKIQSVLDTFTFTD